MLLLFEAMEIKETLCIGLQKEEKCDNGRAPASITVYLYYTQKHFKRIMICAVHLSLGLFA